MNTSPDTADPLAHHPLYPRLLGDVGGTNARFAWQQAPDAPLSGVATYPCADHASLLDVVRHHLEVSGCGQPRAAGIGIATPVTGDEVRMTNLPWAFSTAELQRQLELERLAVVNDFTALALSLPALSADDMRQVGGAQAAPAAAVALIGPGTGLGVSGLLPGRDGRLSVPIAGEGGHVTLAGTNAREDAVILRLRERFGHASAERALSGPGLVNLRDALGDIDGVTRRPLSAAQVADAAQAGDDPLSVEARDLFFALLGTTAGNLALSLGARGGVFIGGGIVPRFGDAIHASRFRERFEGKGRFSAYLSPIPVFVVHAAFSPALVGAGRALDLL